MSNRSRPRRPALNYCQDLTLDQLTEDSAGIVRKDRDRLLAALRVAVDALHAATSDLCFGCPGGAE